MNNKIFAGLVQVGEAFLVLLHLAEGMADHNVI